jgi:hypothetical protein
MKLKFAFFLLLAIGAVAFTSCSEDSNKEDAYTPPTASGYYVSGDFHQHTTYTDGSWSVGHVMKKCNEFNLDWWVNSEHGGASTYDAALSGTDMAGALITWASKNPCPSKGTDNGGKMWRWQVIKEFSFGELLKARALYPSKTVIQGMEWNVPGHEHASTGIIGNQFAANANANAVAEFEYKFDNNDADMIGGEQLGWTKSTKTGHEKALEGIAWMQANYPKCSWVIPAHPERKSLYTIADFRDMNNAGPDVCFGFESMPGHQKSPERGEYKVSSKTYGSCTYGGCGFMSAKVGGLWDAMLSEGRHFWLFANSDFHDIANDFYPGEYQKNYVNVAAKNDAQAIADGLRSGNCFVVTGDLVDELRFFAGSATMGQTYNASSNSLTVYIKIHDPNTNNAGGVNPALNHIDLIAGTVAGKISPSDAAYKVDQVSTTKVIARFDATGGVADGKGMVSVKWKDLGNGYKEIVYTVSNVASNMYFRLRGTNLGLNVANQTDADGNPLPDTLLEPNSATKAFDDLWFYSNPVFVTKK